MTQLDPRFGKIVARMRATTFDGEQKAARTQAEKLATRAGLKLDEALRIHDAPSSPPKPTASPFAGFDDFMEARQPGWRAEQAAKKANRNAAWAVRKQALLDRYGSMAAAVAPCWREALILNAVKPFREADPSPDRLEGWTDSLDGYRHWPDVLPGRVREAIRGAYPMPATFAEAKHEHDYWEIRNDELDDLFSEDGAPLGDFALDKAAQVRADIIRDLVRTEMPVTTLRDLHTRLSMLVNGDTHEVDMEKALLRDLTAMVEQEASTSAEPIRPDRHGQIAEALKADPNRSDRDIARAFGCSPTTVGKVRQSIGLSREVRSVQRGGQTFTMKPPRQERA